MAFYNLSFLNKNQKETMFQAHSYSLLQQLKNSLSQIQLIDTHQKMQKPLSFSPSHHIQCLKEIEQQLSQSLDQFFLFLSDITQKISPVIKHQCSQTNKVLDFHQIFNFIEQAVARQRLGQFQFGKSRLQLLELQPQLSKFPALQKQIQLRSILSQEIQSLSSNFTKLEQKFQIQAEKSEKTLKSLDKRLKNLIQEIDESEVEERTEKKVVSLPEYVKQHRQAETILNLIYQGNLCLLEQTIQKIQNSQFKRAASKVAREIKRCDQSILGIYDCLNQANRTNKAVCENFPNSVNYMNFSKKLKECQKLITFLSKSSIKLSSLQSQSQKKQAEEEKVHINTSKNAETFQQSNFQLNILLLKKEEIIYDLQQQIDLLRDLNNSLALQSQGKSKQNQKLLAEYAQVKRQDQKMKTLNNQLKKTQLLLQDQVQIFKKLLLQAQLQKNQLNLQLQKATEDSTQLRTNLQLHINNSATLKAANLKYLTENNEMQKVFEEMQNQLIFLRELSQQRQKESCFAQVQIKQLQVILQKAQEKSLPFLNLQSSSLSVWITPTRSEDQNFLNLQSSTLSVCIKQAPNYCKNPLNLQSSTLSMYIAPTGNNFERHSIQDHSQKRNISQLAFQEAVSEQFIKIEKEKTGKLNMKHSKSFSGEQGVQLMSWILSKKEQQFNISNQSDQMYKMMISKDKTIKKYEGFINKYRIQTKKYQKQILDLQAKTKKLQLQNLQLNQIVEEQATQKELLAIQQQPCDIQNIDISQQLLQESHIQKLTEKQVQLRVKEESINFKIEGIINTVLQLNAFKTETKQSTQTSIVYHQLQDLGLDSFNPQSHS